MYIQLTRVRYDTNDNSDVRRLKKYIYNLHYNNKQHILDSIVSQIASEAFVGLTEIDIYKRSSGLNPKIVNPKYSFEKNTELPYLYTLINDKFVSFPRAETKRMKAYCLIKSLIYPQTLKVLKGETKTLCIEVVKKVFNKYLAMVEKELKWTSDSSVVISYRDEGRGSGAFFDHYTIQASTGKRTKIAISLNENVNDLISHIHERSEHFLKNGSPDVKYPDRLVPERIDQDPDDAGLLIIPGRSRQVENKRPLYHKLRTERERELIAKAIRTGQPILAICAGSWSLWNYFGGKTKEVSHHACRRMPAIKASDGKIGWNIQVHRLTIENGSMLSNFTGNKKKPKVNSVHWLAPDEVTTPKGVTVCARSKKDGAIAPSNMNTEDASVEAFETTDGAPVLGVQWHPEAYNSRKGGNFNILRNMALSGDVYKIKRRMLRELMLKI